VIDIDQFKEYVIDPTLETLGLYSVAASELLLGTAIQESRLTYLKQLGGGPALGVCQMEPATHDDIWNHYLKYRETLRDKVMAIAPHDVNALVFNLNYAVAMCRVHYLRVPEALPVEGDLPAQASYWKKYYNTPVGRGTESEYIENWEKSHEN